MQEANEKVSRDDKMNILERIQEVIRGGVIMALGYGAMRSETVTKAVSRAGDSILSCQQCREIFKYVPFIEHINTATFITATGIIIIVAGFAIFIEAVLGRNQQQQQPQVVVKVEK
jgi:hypothetical protein